MSTSPVPRNRSTLRVVIFVLTVFASITSSTAVVGLDPLESAGLAEPAAVATAPAALAATTTTTTVSQPTAAPIPDDPCSEFLSDFCVEVPIPPTQPTERVGSCSTGASSDPLGSLTVVPGTSPTASDDAVRIRIEIEDGIAVDGECFADAAIGILTDERGWSDIDDVSFVQVDGDSYDLRLILASPSTTDSLCYPARTVGKYSCRKGNRVIINLMRWESGTDDYVGDLTTYRSYLINHEVGHFLGKGHVSCPAAGEPAPVMMQQTKGLGDCLPNGWPTKDEH